MINTLVPVLLLATVALSSSKILPIMPMKEKPYGQTNDNIMFSKNQPKDKLSDVLFKIIYENDKSIDSQDTFRQENFNGEEDSDGYNMVKDGNYDVKGFRKEQWHNYPRQLHRLNKYLYEHSNNDKRNLDPDDPSEPNNYSNIEENPNDITFDEKVDGNFDSLESIDEVDKAAALMNPLIVLKIHLACLNRDKFPEGKLGLDHDFSRKEYEYYNGDDENPKLSVMKVKRENGAKTETAEIGQSEPKNRMVNKRIFSLWSRLQNMNHKGHELQHRRHLYAYYGLSDSEGGPSGGVLTAETRATFLRPPGSPLRWG